MAQQPKETYQRTCRDLELLLRNFEWHLFIHCFSKLYNQFSSADAQHSQVKGRHSQPLILHLDFWKSRSWEIKVCFQTLEKIKWPQNTMNKLATQQVFWACNRSSSNFNAFIRSWCWTQVSKLLAPVVYFAKTFKSSIWAAWAEQQAQYTWFLFQTSQEGLDRMYHYKREAKSPLS